MIETADEKNNIVFVRQNRSPSLLMTKNISKPKLGIYNTTLSVKHSLTVMHGVKFLLAKELTLMSCFIMNYIRNKSSTKNPIVKMI